MRAATSILLVFILQGCGESKYQGSSHNETGVAVENNSSLLRNARLPIHSDRGWRGPVEFYVASNLPQRIAESAIHAAAVWNRSTGLDLFRYKGVIDQVRGENLYSSLDDQDTVIYLEENWVSTTNKPVATIATTVWENDSSDSRYISRGDIILNGEKYIFQDATIPIIESGDKTIADAITVLIHEFGHLLGMSHTEFPTDPDSIMLPRTDVGPGLYKRGISLLDIEIMQAIYLDR